MEDLIINERIIIPSNEITISAVRSSGPGGQNVNKVATCIELRFNPKKSISLDENLIQKILSKNKNRLDSEGAILITSQRFREQYRNIEDACEKLKTIIIDALKVQKKRKPTKPSKSSIENRINKKKINGLKKANRSKIIVD